MAASLGDLVTVSLLAFFGNLVYESSPVAPGFPVMAFIFLMLLLITLIASFIIAYRNEYTGKTIFSGWLPIFIAMVIAIFSGIVLDHAVDTYKTYAIFQPVINGVGGDLGAIHSSRLSTTLHKQGGMGKIPANIKIYRNPFRAFFDGKGIICIIPN